MCVSFITVSAAFRFVAETGEVCMCTCSYVCTCTSTCGGQRSTNIVLYFIFRDRVSPWTRKLIGSSRAADQQAPEILLPPLQQCEDCKFVPITAFLCGRWDSQSSSPRPDCILSTVLAEPSPAPTCVQKAYPFHTPSSDCRTEAWAYSSVVESLPNMYEIWVQYPTPQ